MGEQTFTIVTFGCKVNQYESQAIRETLLRAGYKEVSLSGQPDLWVINTCAVTQATENECRRLIRRCARDRSARTIVTGCLAKVAAQNSIIANAHVEVISKEAFARAFQSRESGTPKANPEASDFDLRVSGHAGHARAFLKIQDGCDATCSYCIVPRARGKSRSRPLPDILAEAERLVRNGYNEIVLTGVNIGRYGKDSGQQGGLAYVVGELLKIKKVGRLRLGSIEPMDVDDALLRLVASDSRVCPHFHIPLQSGDDEVLARMQRGYTVRDYCLLMDKIKKTIPLPALTTDIIVGFPGETDEAFARTVEVSRRIGFSRIHVFTFSARPGTAAATLPGHVPVQIVRRRKETLRTEAARLAADYHRQMLGREADLLVEYGRDPRSGLLHGHTERYVGVLVAGPDNWMGHVRRVKITVLREGHLYGEVVS